MTETILQALSRCWRAESLLGYPAGIALVLTCDPQEAGQTVVERSSYNLVRYLSGKSGAVKPIEDKARSDKDHRDARDVAGEFFVGGRLNGTRQRYA
jgi:hypothetical protein